ncbi:hypothetical protein VTL71DRAFT_4003 [Oculimacula yallundae]|uniref:Uncharacterized protein n=1 Tax=Oculimacula yallundae TaxID=86028 RepID=A0ABR4C4L2_9HELO
MMMKRYKEQLLTRQLESNIFSVHAGAFYLIGQAVTASTAITFTNYFSIAPDDNNALCDDGAPEEFTCKPDNNNEGQTCSVDWANNHWTASFDGVNTGYVTAGTITWPNNKVDVQTDPRCQEYKCDKFAGISNIEFQGCDVSLSTFIREGTLSRYQILQRETANSAMNRQYFQDEALHRHSTFSITTPPPNQERIQRRASHDTL